MLWIWLGRGLRLRQTGRSSMEWRNSMCRWDCDTLHGVANIGLTDVLAKASSGMTFTS